MTRAHKFNKEYRDLLSGSYQTPYKQQAVAAKYNYIRDPKSTRSTQILYKNGQPHIVHRGTKTMNDWVDNSLIAVGLGNYSHRVKEAKRARSYLKSQGHDKVVHLGHSLGGELSRRAATKDDETHIYNPHTIGFTSQRYGKNDYTYRTPTDLASLSLISSPYNLIRSQFGNKIEHVHLNKASSWLRPIKAHDI
jgi:hypothetical protein